MSKKTIKSILLLAGISMTMMVSANDTCIYDVNMHPTCYSLNTTQHTAELTVSLMCDTFQIPNQLKGKTTSMSDSAWFSVKSIGSGAFQNDNCLKSILIPSTISHIGTGSFSSLSNLHTVHLVDTCSRLTIDDNAFFNCYSLRSVTLPVGTDTLRAGAFNQCHGLKTLFIPNTVKYIGTEVWRNCDRLKDVYVEWNGTQLNAINASSSCFDNVKTDTVRLHIPNGTKAAYDTIAPWKYFKIVIDTAYVITAPTAVDGLVYTGTAQALLNNNGVAEGGTLNYSLNNIDWSEAIPSAIPAGNYTVYYMVVGDATHSDYTPLDNTIAVSIAKAPLTIKADDTNLTYGDPVWWCNHATYTGFVNGEDVTVLSGAVQFDNEYSTGSNVGVYTITPYGVTAVNYDITFVSGTVTVNKADVSYTAPTAIAGLEYNGAAQTLINAGSATGGEMQYRLNDGAYSTALPQATDAGDYTVWYRVVGDQNHEDVAPAAIVVTIAAPSVLVITANPDPDHPSDYYSTFYHSAVAYELPAGTAAYVAELSTDALLLTRIAEGGQVLPENTAVIFKANSNTIILTPSDDTPVSFTAANSLQGVDVPTAAPSDCYVLSGHSSDYSVTGLGFYQCTIPLKAHKAYVVIDGGGSHTPKRLRFVFNTPTDIEQITNDPYGASRSEELPMTNKTIIDGQFIIIKNGVRYNAQGQIVNQ